MVIYRHKASPAPQWLESCSSPFPHDIHSKLYTQKNVMTAENILQMHPMHFEIVSSWKLPFLCVYTRAYICNESIDIEVYRLTIGFQNVGTIIILPAVHHNHSQFCVAYSTDRISTDNELFKRYFHKSCKTYQLNISQ